MLDLKNKRILVTGASSGIGRQVAIACAEAGASLFMVGRNEERLNETFIRLNGTNHQKFILDLTNEDAWLPLFEAITEGLDGVVHCAGVNTKYPVKFLDKSKIEGIMEINFNVPVLITQKLLKLKKLNKEGSQVFISSISSSYAAVSNAIYGASKGALDSFTKVLALELASQKIRVNTVSPGLIQGEMLENYELKDELLAFEKSIPLGRLGKYEDVSNAVVFLLSAKSSWITGTDLKIDGGITLK
jgi:NAD(P)-dependent dehydrogenase (short-subunit alcohol dehydrogenase family)